MDFKTAVTSVLKTNYANFNGRARRSEYWYYTLFTIIVELVLTVIQKLTSGVPVVGMIVNILIVIIGLALFIPGLALCFRRLHDTGRSGIWILIGLIPLIGEIILIVFFVQDSQPGDNKYGANPKGV